jgi:Fic-DOC domain mobile mystery protein B
MGLNLGYIDGQTALDEDEKEGLLIPTITTRSDLDEFEQLNIEEAIQWLTGKSFSAETLLSERFIRSLHKRMFGDVWSWAGTFRKSNKSIGVDKWHIIISIKDLCDDARNWIANDTFPPDEIAIRFKHRIVSIHCFPNGNGRHSRIMTDLVIENVFNRDPFTWGSNDLTQSSTLRQSYIQSLRLADSGEFEPLIGFARS